MRSAHATSRPRWSRAPQPRPATARGSRSTTCARCPGLGAFDLVCCLDDAVNYALGADELEATFAGFARNLAPGGVVVFDANSLAAYRTFFASMTVLAGDDLVLVWEGHARPTSPPAPWRRPRSRRSNAAPTAPGDAGAAPITSATTRARPSRAPWAGLGSRAVAVHGMRFDGSTTDDFDELGNSKAVYIARVSAQDSEGR